MKDNTLLYLRISLPFCFFPNSNQQFIRKNVATIYHENMKTLHFWQHG